MPALVRRQFTRQGRKQTAGIQTANKKATVKVAFWSMLRFAGVF
jgi:hypothetical protein